MLHIASIIVAVCVLLLFSPNALKNMIFFLIILMILVLAKS